MKVLSWQLIEILETFLFILRKQKLLNMRSVLQNYYKLEMTN